MFSVFLPWHGILAPTNNSKDIQGPHILSGVIPKVKSPSHKWRLGRRRRGPLFLDTFSWNFALTIDSLGQDDICWYFSPLERIAPWEFRGKGAMYSSLYQSGAKFLSHCCLTALWMKKYDSSFKSHKLLNFLLSFRKFSWVNISSLLYALQTISRVFSVFSLIIIFYQFYWGMSLWSFLHCHARSGILCITSFILSLIHPVLLGVSYYMSVAVVGARYMRWMKQAWHLLYRRQDKDKTKED